MSYLLLEAIACGISSSRLYCCLRSHASSMLSPSGRSLCCHTCCWRPSRLVAAARVCTAASCFASLRVTASWRKPSASLCASASWLLNTSVSAPVLCRRTCLSVLRTPYMRLHPGNKYSPLWRFISLEGQGLKLSLQRGVCCDKGGPVGRHGIYAEHQCVCSCKDLFIL